MEIDFDWDFRDVISNVLVVDSSQAPYNLSLTNICLKMAFQGTSGIKFYVFTTVGI